MRKSSHRCAAQPRGVDQAGVGELVQNYRIAFADEGRNRPERGGVTAAENQRRFLFLPRRELFLQREHGGVGAGDQTRSARAGAVSRRGLARRFDQGGMVAQPEVIVGREVEQARIHRRATCGAGWLFQLGQFIVED